MKEEFIADFIPGVRAHISIGNSTHTWVGSNLHFHNEFELIQILDGKLKVKTDHSDFSGQTGDIIFIGSRVPHQTGTFPDCPTKILLIQFDPKQIQDNYLLKLMGQNNQEFQVFQKNQPLYEEISSILHQLSREYANKELGYKLYLRAWLYTLLGFLTRNRIILGENWEQKQQLIQKISPLIEYVEQHYSQDISLETAGNLLNLHPAYFCKIFKQATGKTFTNYLNLVRVSKAEDLLIFTDKSVTEIACETGFSNIQYFNRIFKSVHGRTPSDFRKLQFSI